jgi:hypothetical protein
MKTRIIYFLAIAVTTFLIRSSASQTLFTEDFSYPAMNNIAGMNGWILGYAPIPANSIPVLNTGLTFNGYPGSGVGNSILIRNDSAQSSSVKKEFTEQTSGKVYLSLMLRVDSLTLTASEDFLVSLDKGGATSDFRCFLLMKKYNSSTFFLGIRKSNINSYSPTLLNKNQTYLVVLKYQFFGGSSTNDSASLFIIPSTIPVNEPAADQVTATGNDSPGLGEIHINNHAYGQFGSGLRRSSVKLDGIKIAKTWGEAVLTAVEQTSTEVPSSFELKQNYPNPFNPATKINFSLPKSGNVKLSVFDITGKVISTIVNSELSAGSYSADFDAAGLSSGIYFYRLETGNFVSTKKMTLVK